MKQNLINSGLAVFVIAVMVACTPASKESASETIVPTQLSVSTKPSAAAEPSDIEETVSIPITGPPLEVGSVYPYIDGSNLLAVPAGKFIMGYGETDDPEHIVTLNDFWIYSAEVTNQQYTLCVELDQCTIPDLDDNLVYTDTTHANDPVVGVTYDQASAYCEFVNGRLPTEAEWEKAARGPQGSLYPWGDAIPSCDLLNFNNCVSEKTNVVNYRGGHSYYGGLDMAGNAFEWVADWYDPNYYNNSPLENPPGPDSGTTRSVRSSSFESNADQVEIVIRNSEDPQNHRPDLGFRCVVDNPTYFAPFCESPSVYSSDADGASTQNFSSSTSCPELDISQAKYCVRKLPVTNITFSDPPDSTIDAVDCTPTDNPALFVCQSPGTIVSIAADCQVDISGNSSCPPGYSLQGDTCEADGAQGKCLSGYNFNATQQCCVAVPDQDGFSIDSVCPVGTFYVNGQNACVPYPVQSVVSITRSVEFTVCSAGSGDGGGGGSCQPQACGLSEFWDSDLCCCTVDGFSC